MATETQVRERFAQVIALVETEIAKGARCPDGQSIRYRLDRSGLVILTGNIPESVDNSDFSLTIRANDNPYDAMDRCKLFLEGRIASYRKHAEENETLRPMDRQAMEAMAEQMEVGEHVLVLAGNHKGEAGRFMGFGIDSGYKVPFIAVGDQARWASRTDLIAGLNSKHYPAFMVAKPWAYEVVSPRLLKQHRDALERKLRQADGFLEQVNEAMEDSPMTKLPSDALRMGR
jgi:hypothetical protein